MKERKKEKQSSYAVMNDNIAAICLLNCFEQITRITSFKRKVPVEQDRTKVITSVNTVTTLKNGFERSIAAILSIYFTSFFFFLRCKSQQRIGNDASIIETGVIRKVITERTRRVLIVDPLLRRKERERMSRRRPPLYLFISSYCRLQQAHPQRTITAKINATPPLYCYKF
jgi:hypothetical protein